MWKTHVCIYTVLVLCILLSNLNPTAALSDQRLCADEKCVEIISFGKGKIMYPAGAEGMVSFRKNDNIRIKSKSAGKDPSLWGIEVNGRQGYAPKDLILETRVLIAEKNLKYTVPVASLELSPSEAPVMNTPFLNAEKKVGIESSPNAVPENDVKTPILATPVLDLEIVDGTKIATTKDPATIGTDSGSRLDVEANVVQNNLINDKAADEKVLNGRSINENTLVYKEKPVSTENLVDNVEEDDEEEEEDFEVEEEEEIEEDASDKSSETKKTAGPLNSLENSKYVAENTEDNISNTNDKPSTNEVSDGTRKGEGTNEQVQAIVKPMDEVKTQSPSIDKIENITNSSLNQQPVAETPNNQHGIVSNEINESEIEKVVSNQDNVQRIEEQNISAQTDEYKNPKQMDTPETPTSESAQVVNKIESVANEGAKGLAPPAHVNVINAKIATTPRTEGLLIPHPEINETVNISDSSFKPQSLPDADADKIKSQFDNPSTEKINIEMATKVSGKEDSKNPTHIENKQSAEVENTMTDQLTIQNDYVSADILKDRPSSVQSNVETLDAKIQTTTRTEELYNMPNPEVERIPSTPNDYVNQQDAAVPTDTIAKLATETKKDTLESVTNTVLPIEVANNADSTTETIQSVIESSTEQNSLNEIEAAVTALPKPRLEEAAFLNQQTDSQQITPDPKTEALKIEEQEKYLPENTPSTPVYQSTPPGPGYHHNQHQPSANGQINDYFMNKLPRDYDYTSHTPQQTGDGSPQQIGDGTPQQTGDGTPQQTEHGSPQQTGDGTVQQTGDGTPQHTGDGTPQQIGDYSPHQTEDTSSQATPPSNTLLNEPNIQIEETEINQHDHKSTEISTESTIDATITSDPSSVDPIALPSKTPQEVEATKQIGLFATIVDTVNSFLSLDKKETIYDGVHNEPDDELRRLLYAQPGEAPNHHHHHDDISTKRQSWSERKQHHAQADDYCHCDAGHISMESFFESFAMKLLEMRELLACLTIAAASILFFIFGYYCFCNSSREGALLSKLNLLERSLLASQKESVILKHDLLNTRTKLSSIEDNSFGSNDMVKSLKKELDEEISEKRKLQEQVGNLEKELENAAEAGLELNKIVSELLSNQSGDESIISSVEELQKQLNEQQDTILEINATLAEKSRENSELQMMIAEQSARLEAQVSALQQDNDELDAEKSNLQTRLEEIKSEFDLDITKALEGKNFEIKRLQTDITDLKTKWEHEHTKWQTSLAKVEALEDCLKTVKKDSNININEVIDMAYTRAELLDVQKRWTSLKDQLDMETDSKRLAENQLQIATGEVEKLKQDFHKSEKDKLEAQTRLEVLSNYFKEKETQLQKELSLKEAMWLKQQGEATSTVDRLTTMQDDIQSLRSQNDSLRAEIVAQLAAHKAQIGTLENRAHESWLAARQFERRFEESRAESTALRRKLTTIAGVNPNELNRAVPNISGVDAKLNSELNSAPSPIHMESPGSPLLGRMPPPFLPPPFMGPPPPFMGIPPPFLPPGEMRPAPLGRIMSPPPANSSGPSHHIGRYSPDPDHYDDYDDDDDDEEELHRRRRSGNNNWHRNSYSPPPRTYRPHSPSDSRYNYTPERDLMSTYDTETDFSPPPSPPDRRARYKAYSPQPTAASSTPINEYNNRKGLSGASKGILSSGSEKSNSSLHRGKGKPKV